jgi:DNA polymerase IIIc chi subunit
MSAARPPQTIEFVNQEDDDKLMALCRAVQRHYDRGETVTVLAAGEAQAEEFSARLWTFAQQAFIPHEFAASSEGIDVDRVLIASGPDSLPAADVLVLGAPCEMARYEGYATIVDFAEVYDEALRDAARERFARCRDAGYRMIYLR